MKITIEFYIFELVFVLNFSFNNVYLLDQICPKRIFSVDERKSEHTPPINSAYSNWSRYQNSA